MTSSRAVIIQKCCATVESGRAFTSLSFSDTYCCAFLLRLKSEIQDAHFDLHVTSDAVSVETDILYAVDPS